MDMMATFVSLGFTSEEFMDAERAVNSAFSKVPAHKRPVYEGAVCVIRAANDMYPKDDKDIAEEEAMLANPATMNRIVYRRAGRADRLLAAIDSFAASFCGGDGPAQERKAVEIVQRISDWFGQLGLEEAKKEIARQLQNAKELHNAGLALHIAQSKK